MQKVRIVLTLITFEGCPNASRIVSLLEDLGLSFDRIDQTRLPPGHPYQHYSSPTLLSEGTILFGSRTDGDGGCSLSLPTDNEIRAILRGHELGFSHNTVK